MTRLSSQRAVAGSTPTSSSSQTGTITAETCQHDHACTTQFFDLGFEIGLENAPSPLPPQGLALLRLG